MENIEIKTAEITDLAVRLENTKLFEFKECPICLSESNSKNWPVCPKCQKTACITCTKRFLLDLKDIHPMCMHCKTVWNYEFVASNTDQDFHNRQYRNKIASIIFDREKSLLPDTQPLAQKEKEKDELKAQLDKIAQEMHVVKKKLDSLREEKKSMLEKLADMGFVKNEASPKQKYNGFCPKNDCKGYLEADYTCGMCKEKACKTCRCAVHKGDCDPNIVANIKFLAKDSKNCPNCRIQIFRIEGCNQMFCTECHTAFDWESGKIEVGEIHNPHYIQWARKNGGLDQNNAQMRARGLNARAMQGDACENIQIHDIDRAVKKFGLDCGKWLEDALRLSGHIRGIILPNCEAEPYNHLTNQDLRVKFLLNKLCIKDWVKEIKRREKQREKQTEIRSVLVMLANTLRELLNNIAHAKDVGEAVQFIEQLHELQKYVQKTFESIASRFENKTFTLNKNWSMTSPTRKWDFKVYKQARPVPLDDDVQMRNGFENALRAIQGRARRRA